MENRAMIGGYGMGNISSANPYVTLKNALISVELAQIAQLVKEGMAPQLFESCLLVAERQCLLQKRHDVLEILEFAGLIYPARNNTVKENQ